jgi:hypothetical protein
MRALVALVACLLLAGCADVLHKPNSMEGDAVQDTDDVGPTDGNLTLTPVVGGNWSHVVVETKGKAGSWFAAYQALPEPTKILDWKPRSKLTLEPKAGNTTTGLHASFSPIVRVGNVTRLTAVQLTVLWDESGRLTSMSNGDGSQWYHWDYTNVKDTVFVGFYVFIAVNVDWSFSADLELRNGTGPTTFPGLMKNGQGLETFGPGPHAANPVPFATDRTTLTADIGTRGWTHVQFIGDNPFVATYRVTLPDGTAYEEQNRRPRDDGFGVFDAEPGRATADMQATVGRPDVVAIHVATTPEAFPPGFDLKAYADSPRVF